MKNTRIQAIEKKTNWVLILFLINVILMFGRPVDLIPAIGVIKPGLLITIMLIIAWLKSDQVSRDIQEPVIKNYLALAFLTILSAISAYNRGFTFLIFQNEIMYLFGFMFASMLALQTRNNFMSFLKIWIIIAIYLSMTVISRGGTGTGGIYGDENDVGATLVMLLPYLYFSPLLFSSKIIKVIIYTGAALCLLAIIATGSRGAFVGLLAVVGGIFYLSKHKFRLILLGAIASLILLSFFVSDNYIQDLGTISDTEESTSSERLYTWGIGLLMFLDNPLLGVGAGQFTSAICYYQPIEDIANGERSLCFRAAHSSYVTLLSEFGMLGIIFFTLMIRKTIQYIKQCKKIVKSNLAQHLESNSYSDDINFIKVFSTIMILTLVGFFASGAFISILFYPLLWLPIGLIISLNRYSVRIDNQIKSDQQEQ